MISKRSIRVMVALVSWLPAVGSPGAIVGYYNYTFQPGENLFVNQLNNGSNLLSALVPAPPTGTYIQLWNPGTSSYGSPSLFNGVAWSSDFALMPGDAAQLTNPSAASFLNTFTGTVVNPDGVTPFDGDTWIMPAPFSEAAGVYLMGCAAPIAFGPGDPYDRAFDYILGRAPFIGEAFTSMDPVTKAMSTTTYLETGWDHGPPALQVGEAGFFNVVPEPKVVLLLVPLALMLRRTGATKA